MIVATEQGKLEGTSENGLEVFRGIPFAAPPIGPRRFLAPQRAEAWDGTRDAGAFGPVCPQSELMLEQVMGAQEAYPMDEDCLTLNVWTPDVSANLPVMVWIHGGGFVNGTGRSNWYDGATFAREGVVCVTINYRLGALGFLHTAGALGDAFPDSGNLGILDQIAALVWVQENIAAFGGDPGNVTIFGESAGGMSVGTLLGTPAARGLFQKAIPQSGASHNALPERAAAKVAALLLEKAGVTSAGELRAVDAQRLVGVTTDLVGRIFSEPDWLANDGLQGLGMPHQPVIDGRTLDRLPITAVREGISSDVATLVGTCADEWALFAAMQPAPEAGPLSALHELRGLCATANKDFDELVAGYRSARPGATDRDLLIALETDRVFGIPGVRLGEAQAAAGAPTYAYLFAWESPAMGGLLKASHALELPFVWDVLGAPGISFLLGENPPQKLADTMHGAWLSFAKTGDPGWPAYDATRRATMVFNETSEVVDDPTAATRVLWDGLLD